MSSFIAENTIIASSYKNNSLPLEEEGDRKLVLLTHDSHGYHIRILEFSPPLGQWFIKGNLDLPEDSCAQHLPTNPEKYVFSLAFFDNLDDSENPRFFVFLGYGNEVENTYHEIWYFVFDLDNSDYRHLNCGEFDNILAETTISGS